MPKVLLRYQSCRCQVWDNIKFRICDRIYEQLYKFAKNRDYRIYDLKTSACVIHKKVNFIEETV